MFRAPVSWWWLSLVALDCQHHRAEQQRSAPGAAPSVASPLANSSSAGPRAPSSVPTALASALTLVASTTRACREQAAQDFLLRKHHLSRPGASPAEQREILLARQRAVQYRTEQYGYFPGFGRREDNPHPPSYYAATTTFMGFQLALHQAVIPALACVEQALKRECADHPYRPHRVTGLRMHNTYKDYEISNHVYGIALDIDPDQNTCCGCIPPWNQHPLCRKKVTSIYQRMVIPECWVHVFERHGFYWLGHDELEDTMHFEFLGDPTRITG